MAIQILLLALKSARIASSPSVDLPVSGRGYPRLRVCVHLFRLCRWIARFRSQAVGLPPWIEGQVVNVSLVPTLLSWVIIPQVEIENPTVLINLRIPRGVRCVVTREFSSTTFSILFDRVGIAEGRSTGLVLYLGCIHLLSSVQVLMS